MKVENASKTSAIRPAVASPKKFGSNGASFVGERDPEPKYIYINKTRSSSFFLWSPRIYALFLRRKGSDWLESIRSRWGWTCELTRKGISFGSNAGEWASNPPDRSIKPRRVDRPGDASDDCWR